MDKYRAGQMDYAALHDLKSAMNDLLGNLRGADRSAVQKMVDQGKSYTEKGATPKQWAELGNRFEAFREEYFGRPDTDAAPNVKTQAPPPSARDRPPVIVMPYPPREGLTPYYNERSEGGHYGRDPFRAIARELENRDRHAQTPQELKDIQYDRNVLALAREYGDPGYYYQNNAEACRGNRPFGYDDNPYKRGHPGEWEPQRPGGYGDPGYRGDPEDGRRAQPHFMKPPGFGP